MPRTRDQSNILNGGQTIVMEKDGPGLIIKEENAGSTDNLFEILPPGNALLNGFDKNGDLIRYDTEVIDIVINANSLEVGKMVYFDGVQWELANAADEDELATHVIIEIGLNEGTHMKVQQVGKLGDIFSGLTPGSVYYLSPTVPGAITLTKPSVPGQFIQACILATTGEAGWALNPGTNTKEVDEDDTPVEEHKPHIYQNPTEYSHRTINLESGGTGGFNVIKPGSTSDSLIANFTDGGAYGTCTIGRSDAGNYYLRVGALVSDTYKGVVLTGDGRVAARSQFRSASGLSTGALSANPDRNQPGLIVNGDSNQSSDLIVCNNNYGANLFQAKWNGGLYAYGTLSGTDSSAGRLMTWGGNNSLSFAIYGDGDLYARASSGASEIKLGTFSDYRIKDEIADYTAGIEDIKQLRPIVYTIDTEAANAEINRTKDEDDISAKVKAKFDAYNQSIEGAEKIGMIAHEVKSVIPSIVNGEKDQINDDGTMYLQSIDYAGLTPILIQAVKELIDKVETLETEVEALKNP
jgi:hypothetical protein